MHNADQDHLKILAGLAQEYQTKYRELLNDTQSKDPKIIRHLLVVRSEQTTQRFREAQQVFLSSISEHSLDEDAYHAAIALCRCFDEMRILFQFLNENAPE